jgi:nucleotide-binding universal stress UspA family protein
MAEIDRRTPMNSSDAEGKNPVVLVVGYDGTEPAQRALQAAADMLERAPGRLEVVFVAHMPAAAGFSAQAIPAFREGFDQDEQDLERQVEEALGSAEVKWHFQRRNGEIASELLAAAEEQLADEGPETQVVLVVGGSSHKIDRYINSTPIKVVRHDRFRVVVVP